MSKKLTWSIKVNVEDGPYLEASDTITTDAVDTISVNVPKAVDASTPGTESALVQPGPLAEIDFVFISTKENTYGDVANGYLKYAFAQGDTATPGETLSKIILDKAHFMTSDKLVQLYQTPPNRIIFSNYAKDPVTVDIVIARRMPA